MKRPNRKKYILKYEGGGLFTPLNPELANAGTNLVSTPKTPMTGVGLSAGLNAGLGMASQIGSSLITGTGKDATTAKGALSGAASGAALGSVVPGIGTAIGAIGGGLIGGIGGFLGNQGVDIKKEKMERENAMINAQSKYNPNTPIFYNGGRMKKYPGGGTSNTTPLPTMADIIGKDTLQDDILQTRRKEISKYANINDPRLYENPEDATNIHAILRQTGNKQAVRDYTTGWNKQFGTTKGGYYDPDAEGLDFIDPNNPFPAKQAKYKELYDIYNPSVKEETYSYAGLPSGGKGIKPNLQKKAKGGYIVDNRGFANSELEDKEVYRSPQGGMFQVNGATHAQGGIPMNLPQGTEILGKNKIPGTNTTYKKFGDRVANDYSKYMRVLDSKRTPLAKKTASAMLQKTQQEFTDLMDLQESQKPIEEQTQEFAKGGWIQHAVNPSHKGFCSPITKATCTPRRKAFAMTMKKHHGFHEEGGIQQYQGGGNYVEKRNDYYTNNIPFIGPNFNQTFGSNNVYNPTNTLENSNQQVPTNQSSRVNPQVQGIQREGTEGMYRPQSIGMSQLPTRQGLFNPSISKSAMTQLSDQQSSSFTPDRSFNGGANLGQIMDYAPIAYNLAQGIFNKPQNLNAQDFYNPEEGNVNNLMANRRYNVNPELEANRNAQLNYTRALRQGAPSQGQYLGNLQNSQIGRSRSDAEAYARKQNIDNQYLGEEAQMRANLGQQKAQTKLGIQDINDRNKSVARSYIPTALSQLQQANQMNRLMKGMRKSDKDRLAVYKALYGTYGRANKLMEEVG